MKFGKVLTAMITPFNHKGEIDLEESKRIANHLVGNGNDGVILVGTTGESPNLSMDERLLLVEYVSNNIKDKGKKVIVGVGANSTKETIQIVKAFENNPNIDGLMVVTPYYNKPTQEGMFLHFQQIASNTKHPIMLYNVPSRTGSNLLPETVVKLAEIDNIVAIKEASGDLNQVSEIVRLCKGKIDVYSGDDSLTLPMLSIGAVGVVSVAAHIAGNQIKEMIDSFMEGNIKKASDKHLELMPIFKNLFIESNPIPVKLAMNILGFNAGVCRLPLCEPKESTVQVVKEMINNLKQG